MLSDPEKKGQKTDVQVQSNPILDVFLGFLLASVEQIHHATGRADDEIPHRTLQTKHSKSTFE